MNGFAALLHMSHRPSCTTHTYIFRGSCLPVSVFNSFIPAGRQGRAEVTVVHRDHAHSNSTRKQPKVRLWSVRFLNRQIGHKWGSALCKLRAADLFCSGLLCHYLHVASMPLLHLWQQADAFRALVGSNPCVMWWWGPQIPRWGFPKDCGRLGMRQANTVCSGWREREISLGGSSPRGISS